MSVHDIPEHVLRQIFRDEWIEALHSFDSESEENTLRAWDQSITGFIEMIHHAEYFEVDITDELRTMMGEHWQFLVDTGIERFKLMKVSVNGKPYIEIGEMTSSTGESPTEAQAKRLYDAPDGFAKAFAKATVRLMRKHGMAQGNEKKSGGPLSETFRMVLDEVIQDEIDEKVDSFRQSLADEVTAAHFAPWSPPKGGEAHDLPAPE